MKVYTLSIFCLVAMTCSRFPANLFYLLPVFITNTDVRVVSMAESCCVVMTNTDQNPDLLKSETSFLLTSKRQKIYPGFLTTRSHLLNNSKLSCTSSVTHKYSAAVLFQQNVQAHL